MRISNKIGEIKTQHLLWCIIGLLLVIILYLNNLSTKVDNIDWECRNILGKISQ